MADIKSVFPDELLQYMQGGERYLEAYLFGKRAAASYSPPPVSSPRRVLTKREMEGFIEHDGIEINLRNYFSAVGRQGGDPKLVFRLKNFCNYFKDRWWIEFESDVKMDTKIRADATIFYEKRQISAEGYGRISAQPDEGEHLWTRIFPIRGRNVAVYQTANNVRKVYGAGYLFEQGSGIGRHRVL